MLEPVWLVSTGEPAPLEGVKYTLQRGSAARGEEGVVHRSRKTLVIPQTIAILLAAFVLGLPPGAAAHDIPFDITLQVFVRPEGRQLRLLVRVPMSGMRDVEIPRRGPGFLDLARVDVSLRNAATMWLTDAIELYEGDRRLPAPQIIAVRVSLPSDRSFASYDEALVHVVSGPRLPAETELYWEQGLLDVLMEYPIESDRSKFSVRPGVERLGQRVITVLRFMPPGGTVRAFEFSGNPGLVRLDPRWHQAALRFVGQGFYHILDGTDHLLFLLCLVVPFRRFGPLVAVVTSFTAAHTLTLIGSAFGIAPNVLWFPPLVETLVAISIVYIGLENIISPQLERRWLITFGFGLAHGFAFSFALRDTLQFAGSHLLTSLVAFNIGIELGQLLVLVLFVPAVELLFRFVVAERLGTIVVSAVIVHTGWHWMAERAERLSQFQFRWPVFDTLLLVGVLRALMLVLIAAGLYWLIFDVLRPAAERKAKGPDATVGAEEAGRS